MKNCPGCGANVEGLTHHCDCCGALLSTTTSFFIWHTFVTEASGDLYVFMKEIFQKFDGIDYSQHSDILQMIEINVFCYPKSIIIEQGIKNRLYFSTARKKLRLTVVLNYDAYICRSKDEKKEMLRSELKAGFMRIRNRIVQHNKAIDHFFEDITQSL